jgi:hypothetical protein
MSGAILPLPQYAFMAWCSVKAQGQLYLYIFDGSTVGFRKCKMSVAKGESLFFILIDLWVYAKKLAK